MSGSVEQQVRSAIARAKRLEGRAAERESQRLERVAKRARIDARGARAVERGYLIARKVGGRWCAERERLFQSAEIARDALQRIPAEARERLTVLSTVSVGRRIVRSAKRFGALVGAREVASGEIGNLDAYRGGAW